MTTRLNTASTVDRASVLVSGGAGFLGSHFVARWLREADGPMLNLDLLTYAGRALPARPRDDRYSFEQADVADPDAVHAVFARHRPELVVHFAAESHVTRSELDAPRFFRTNVEGTRVMLEAAAAVGARRFVHVSTDEVYGPTLGYPSTILSGRLVRFQMKYQF